MVTIMVFVLLNILLYYININNSININTILIKMQAKYRNLCVTGSCFPLKIVGTIFVFLLYDSVISSHVITESSIIFAKYLPLSQLHEERFQMYSFSHVLCFYTHINIYHYSTFDLSYTSYHKVYIYICMIHVSLMFSIHLFL